MIRHLTAPDIISKLQLRMPAPDPGKTRLWPTPSLGHRVALLRPSIDLARALDAVKPIEEPKSKSASDVENHFAYFD